jgi:D-glycero-alpha-D-manno-heptose-7-phosphate kinase
VIIARTPLRISFVGGGTDLPAWSSRHGGAVVSTAIRKHVTVVVKRLAPFHTHRFRVAYSRTELAPSREAIEHPIVREALDLVGLDEPLEIVSISDVPAGTGLGSSSSFTVALLHALHAHKGHQPSPRQLAEEACAIELDRLGEPIGRQDQYIAAFGGLRHLRFLRDGGVEPRAVAATPERLARLEGSLLAFYTGGQRRAASVLEGMGHEARLSGERFEALSGLCGEAAALLESPARGLDELGPLLDRAWSLKRGWSGVSNPRIDALYQRALEAGARGGKLLGAGGSGFLLLYVPPQDQPAVRAAMADLHELELGLEPEGSRILRLGD